MQQLENVEFPPFDRALVLNEWDGDLRVQPLLNLLSSKTGPAREPEVLEAVKTANAVGLGAPVLLLAGGERLVASGTVGPLPARHGLP
jgi:hypothetical protein